MILQNIFWTLAASVALVCHSTRADSSEHILRKLEDGAISPHRAMKQLLEQLKLLEDGEADGLDADALLEASKMDEQKCSHEALLDRYGTIVRLVYEVGDSEAIVNLLWATWTRQLDLCLKLLTKELEQQFLSKLSQKTRNNLEFYDEIMNSIVANQASLGPVDSSDLADIAFGKYVAERRKEKVQKLSKYGKLGGKVGKMARKKRSQIRQDFKESCAAAIQVLGPIKELVELAQTDLKGAHQIGAQLELWTRVYVRCDQFNKRLSTLDPIELNNFDIQLDELDELDESGRREDI